jgi:hypothetical protein
MKKTCKLLCILLMTIGAAYSAEADPFNVGDKVVVQHNKEKSRGEVVVSARNSQRLLIRLESIVAGRSGIVQVFHDGGNGYQFAPGNKVSVSKEVHSTEGANRGEEVSR